MYSIKNLYKIGIGPSSSHTMGPSLGAQEFKEKFPEAASYRVTLYGSLAATGEGHLTDKAIIDALYPVYTEIIWRPDEFKSYHPNGMKLEALSKDAEVIGFDTIYSIGGGSLSREGDKKQIEDHIYPESSMEEILETVQKDGIGLWEYVFRHEQDDLTPHLETVWHTMRQSVINGLENEGVLPGALKLPRKALNYRMRAGHFDGHIRQISLTFSYALAVAEENASGGQIVTAPTCGACGVLPAVLMILQENHSIKTPRMIRALATAGLIGNIVRFNGSISGAEVGCQGEVGVACAMAAGAAAQLLGGTPAQIEYAAEMGLEHHLGLTCDPVKGLVQIPCIERNAMAAARALDCASFALLGDGTHRISFDTVIKTMMQTGLDLKSGYRETSTGGLAKFHSC